MVVPPSLAVVSRLPVARRGGINLNTRILGNTLKGRGKLVKKLLIDKGPVDV